MSLDKRSRRIPFHKIRPVGGGIKVRLEPEDKLSDVIEVVKLSNSLSPEELAREWGIVLEIGPDAFSGSSPKPDTRISVGDMVVFKKYSGQELKDPNDSHVIYRLLNDDQIWGFISKEDLDECGYDSSYAAEGISNLQQNAIVANLLNKEAVNG